MPAWITPMSWTWPVRRHCFQWPLFVDWSSSWGVTFQLYRAQHKQRSVQLSGKLCLGQTSWCFVRQQTLSGNAVQNWCFLRLLPLLIGYHIRDPCQNATWRLVLQLREIVELICEPAITLKVYILQKVYITTDQVAYLKTMIGEYVYFQTQLFPNEPLKPKHHYLLHYPEMITHFGPLIHLWTLRFESKHTFFQRCARKLHNFKNICKTVAERSRLFQPYLSAGEMFKPNLLLDKEITFYVNDYSNKIQKAVFGLFLTLKIQ